MRPFGKVFLVSGVTDMRKSIDGLSLIVAEQLDVDRFSEAWFIFCTVSGLLTAYGTTLDIKHLFS
ncbi:IS66 Orf2 like protein [Shewanella putrefaciens]|nr:IS66 Orf2 like protein [Shewanella putrefaciens]